MSMNDMSSERSWPVDYFGNEILSKTPIYMYVRRTNVEKSTKILKNVARLNIRHCYTLLSWSNQFLDNGFSFCELKNICVHSSNTVIDSILENRMKRGNCKIGDKLSTIAGRCNLFSSWLHILKWFHCHNV